uniref:AAA family ATPase n=1 Tax=uncultured Abyssibacter sp. TaxID=2320202 RepID=UPI0032B251F3
TYRLPEAQLDRFLMYVKVGYPDVSTERAILRLTRDAERHAAKPVSDLRVSQADVMAMRQACLNLHLDEAVEEYIVQLVQATRTPGAYGDDLARWIEFGVSPRGTLGLERCARAHAWLRDRDYVSPDDVQAVAPDVLRHRVLLSFEAEADGVDSDAVVRHLLERVPVA